MWRSTTCRARWSTPMKISKSFSATSVSKICNERFKEMYPAPRELLQSGRPYPDFLRFLAENGYYGAGDVDAMVAQRVEVCGI